MTKGFAIGLMQGMFKYSSMQECEHCLNKEPSVKKRYIFGICCDDCFRHSHNRHISLMKKHWVAKSEIEEIIQDWETDEEMNNLNLINRISKLLDNK